MMNIFRSLIFVSLALAGAQSAGAKDVLELFVVSPTADGGVSYGRRTAVLNKKSGDPDTVVHALLKNICKPALLHSTSWRWEKDGTLTLTYLAYSEDPRCASVETQKLAYAEILPPQTTDPLKPRPAEIREHDVLAHGLRHITFLMRYSSDDRIRQAVSENSLKFFQGLCGQLAGRFDTAREFSDCAIPGAVSRPR
jgi:hypothetical protein